MQSPSADSENRLKSFNMTIHKTKGLKIQVSRAHDVLRHPIESYEGSLVNLHALRG